MPPPTSKPKPRRRMQMSFPTVQMPSVFYVQGQGSEKADTLSPVKVGIGVGVLVILSIGFGAWIRGK